jgi:hypothetical protein
MSREMFYQIPVKDDDGNQTGIRFMPVETNYRKGWLSMPNIPTPTDFYRAVDIALGLRDSE